jgi:acetyl esterase/lipase
MGSSHVLTVGPVERLYLLDPLGYKVWLLMGAMVMQGEFEAMMERVEKRRVVPLWSAAEPGIDTAAVEGEASRGQFNNIHNPGLTIYEPAEGRANGGAVVVCPGGGYGMVSCINEGYPIAEWLVGLGFKAYILKYRLPYTEGVNYRHPVPLKDAQRAMRMVRGTALDEHRNPTRVGIIGFSAGGHLAATALTQFDSPVDPDEVSCRPDFGMLIYPVISCCDDALCHTGSRDGLLGPDASEEERRAQSPELNVAANTPSIFFAHARNDGGVPFGNSVVMQEALRDAGVPTELHLYEEGGHGFGMGAPEQDCAQWTEAAAGWLVDWR